jgi:hypothetical protein
VVVSTHDCAFEKTDFLNPRDDQVMDSMLNDFDHNAYASSHYFTDHVGANDVYVEEFDWQTGPLGDFYLPHAGINLAQLVDAGSRDADVAGLYHFTSTVDQAPEADSVVDIGYHYVVTDDRRLPLDHDVDGLPDYVEDHDGDGTVDSGETDRMDAGDLGLKVLITHPADRLILR